MTGFYIRATQTLNGLKADCVLTNTKESKGGGKTQTYSKPIQTLKMEHFAKIVINSYRYQFSQKTP